MRSFIAIPVITVALASALTACGEDEPAVCGSVKSLDASVNKVKAIDVTSSGAISDLRSGLTAVGGDLRAVKDDAKSEFAKEIDAVEASYASLRTSLKTAKDDTSPATLGAARKALSAFGTAVQSLITDIQSTC
jgi:hypothetical protein